LWWLYKSPRGTERPLLLLATKTMTECLPDIPRYFLQRDDGSWYGADHQNGPWRPIPAPQSGMPWPTDGPAAQSREPASVAAEVSPLSPDTRALLAVIDFYGYDTPRITVAQSFRALAFLRPTGPITPDQLVRIAEELDP
jgi:hypothetical protein